MYITTLCTMYITVLYNAHYCTVHYSTMYITVPVCLFCAWGCERCSLKSVYKWSENGNAKNKA